MKKKLFCLLLAIVLFAALLACPACAKKLPDWYPEDVSAFEDFHTSAFTTRVVDDADIFTDAEEARIKAAIASLQDKYGIDYVVYTDDTDYGMDHELLADDFHHFNGYGFGEDYNGTALFICMEPGNRDWWTVWTGACKKYWTEENLNWVDDAMWDDMRAGNYADAVLTHIEKTAYLYEHGGPKKDASDVLSSIVPAAIVAFLAALFISAPARKSMPKVAQATDANRYLLRDSFNLYRSNNVFLYRNVSRVRRETETRSGGGGSSTYHSSSHSSGGRSYGGGGGRKF